MVLNLETLTGAGWGLGVGWGRWIRGSGGGGRGVIHDLLNSCLFQEFSHEGSFVEEKKQSLDTGGATTVLGQIRLIYA